MAASLACARKPCWPALSPVTAAAIETIGIVVDPVRGLGSLEYHRIYFKVPAEFMGGASQNEIRALGENGR